MPPNLSHHEHHQQSQITSPRTIVLETARTLAREVDNLIVTFNRTDDKPRHLDDFDNNNTTLSSDYYSTLVDIHLAGSGRCVTYGRGGFGRLAALLSIHSTCHSKHVKQVFPNT